jgi:predicted RNase H-like HicB family nuclease
MAKKSSKIRADVKTQYGTYACVFEREPDMGGYAVEAPAVQGVVSWGKNLARAKKMAAEAIELVIEARAISNARREGLVKLTPKARRAVFA